MAKTKTNNKVRKIVSQTDDTTTMFPSLNFPLHKFFEEDTEVNGIMQFKGDRDTSYPTEFDKENIWLLTIDKKRYDSVHEEMTEEMLEPTDDNDFTIETKLDGNFTFTVLRYNGSIANKYKEDPEYLNKLGLPSYDPAVHNKDLISLATIPEEILKKAQEVAEEEEARFQANQEKIKAGETTPETVDLEAVAKMFQEEAKRLAAESVGDAITHTEQV